MSKLNLGCGELVRSGFINVDERQLPGVDKIVDIGGRLPWVDGMFDYVLAEDVLEHFPLARTGEVLTEWVRVLAQRGTIELFVPNVRKHIDMLLKGECSMTRFSQLLYGGQDYPGNFHYRCFDMDSIKEVMNKCGLIARKVKEEGRGIRAWGEKL